MADLSLAGIFGAGVLTFFAPCVLPLIPIYLSALVGADIRQAGAFGRWELITKSLVFSAGFILVFSLLGLSASALGGFLTEHKAAMQLAGGALILVFALKFMGVIRISALDRVLRFDDKKLNSKIGLVNAFVMGVVFAAGWSPCVGPILGSVLTYAASKTSDMAAGAMYLAVYGAGFAVPLVAVAAFAQAGVGLLRKAYKFLPIFEKAVGILLLIAATLMMGDAAKQQYNNATSDEKKSAALKSEAEEYFKNFPALVEFYSADCPICKQMAPLMEGIKAQCHGNMVDVLQIDVTKPENKHFVKKFRLLGMPTFVFFDKKGEEAARLIGAQTEQTIKQALSVLRGSPCPGVTHVQSGYLEQIDGSAGASCGGGTEETPKEDCGSEESK